MKKILLSTTFIIYSFSILSQINSRQFEIEPFIRWDSYPTFANTINSIATYDLSIKGKSWGINTAYKIPIKSSFLFKAGLGYYRYSFTDIVSSHQSFGKSDSRVIDYPTQLGITLGTDRYWYNTLSMSLGVEKLFEVNKDFIIIGGLAARNYFTISQRYHLPFDNSFIPQPELQIQNNYQTSKKENFGFGGELNLGILKKIGKLYIGPSLIIPVYDSWKQDSIFPTENSSGSRNKLLRGLGANIKFIYTIK
jgi:hypothetical protein